MNLRRDLSSVRFCSSTIFKITQESLPDYTEVVLGALAAETSVFVFLLKELPSACCEGLLPW